MKLKTKQAAKKRIKIMGSGRVKRGQAGKRHKTGKKSSKVTRRLRQTASVNDKDIALVRRVFPYARDIRH
ncbi:MAG: 50S ribosomal protein L35 [bacterium]|nr:50S ribosomal protein L35 [bacterium]